MGKKKDKHGRKHDHEEGGGRRQPGGDGARGAFAGIAAMALAQVKNQLDTPAGRQMMATGLRAAADALAPKPSRAAEAKPAGRDAAPTPPNAFADNPSEPPSAPAPPPRPDLPPEIARVIGSVATGLEKWAAGLGRPKG